MVVLAKRIGAAQLYLALDATGGEGSAVDIVPRTVLAPCEDEKTMALVSFYLFFCAVCFFVLKMRIILEYMQPVGMCVTTL